MNHFTAAVFLCVTLPSVVFKLTASFRIQKFSFGLRILLTCLLSVASFVVTPLVGDHWGPKLLGVIVGAVATSLGEVTCLQLSTHYSRSLMALAYSSGNGLSGMLANGWLILFRSHVFSSEGSWDWRYSFFTAIAVPICYCFIYFFLLTKPTVSVTSPSTGPSKPPLEGVDLTTIAKTTSNDQPVTAGETSLKESVNDTTANQTTTPHEDSQSIVLKVKVSPTSHAEPKGWRAKAKIVWKLKKYMIPMISTYFCTYLCLTGILPSLGPRETFTPVLLLFKTAAFLGRSSTYWVPLRKLWVFPLVQGAILAFLLVEGFYHFCNIYALCGVFFAGGLVVGAIYSNVMLTISEDLCDDTRALALGVASAAYNLGQVVACCAGLGVQPAYESYWEGKR